MIINVKNNGVELPTKAHLSDVGWDIKAKFSPVIKGESIEVPAYEGGLGKLWSSINFIEYDSGLSVTPPDGYYCSIIPRSSISLKNLILINSPSTIDPEYTGPIILRFKWLPDACDIITLQEYGVIKTYFRVNPEKIYSQGDKIAQLIIQKYNDVEWRFTDDLKNTLRAEKGFGSSGN